MMKASQARLLLKVEQLEASISFYTDQLGWHLVEQADAEHAAVLLQIVEDYRVVVTEHGCSADWLQPKPSCPKPGDLVYIGVASVNEVHQFLLDQGVPNLRKEEDPGHIRKLFVPTPDGYLLVYWEELSASNEEILAMYHGGITELEAAVAHLSEEQLNLQEAPGKWSIREQVLHVIDLELVTIHKVKFALAEPGRSYTGNSFSQDDWSVGLRYASRPIHDEVLMFRALRQHILNLCACLPGALGRTVVTSKDREETVAKLLKMMAGHASHHIRAIWRIRTGEYK
ncbi:DinB family protein [Paenibacillus marchantiophytorum]|nr:DinB family protein [Paenibacillus marchantiophytorum]